MNAAPDTIFRIPASVVTREIVGETLLVPISGDLADMDHIFALNPSGAFIWSQLDGEKSLEHIRDALCRNFTVERTQAWQDLQDLLAQLQAAGLVETVS